MPETVTHPQWAAPNVEMSAFGYLIAAILLVIVLPLLPFLVVVWALARLTGYGNAD